MIHRVEGAAALDISSDRESCMKDRKSKILGSDFGLSSKSTRRRPSARRAPSRSSIGRSRPPSASGVWTTRRASKFLTPAFFLHMAAYVGGIALVVLGIYGGGSTLSRRGTSDEILNDLLFIFFGFFLIFLANHEKAVAKKPEI